MRKMLNELHENNNFDQPADPVFVIGLPRSGTSLLFNSSLSLDIAHRSPMYWEIDAFDAACKNSKCQKKKRI